MFKQNYYSLNMQHNTKTGTSFWHYVTIGIKPRSQTSKNKQETGEKKIERSLLIFCVGILHER